MKFSIGLITPIIITGDENHNPLIVDGYLRYKLIRETWDNIDFSTGRIYVTNSVCELKDKIIIKTTKTDASKRSMIIPSFMLDLLTKQHYEFDNGGNRY